MSIQSAYLNPPRRRWTRSKARWYIGLSVLPAKESKDDVLSRVLRNASVASSPDRYQSMTTSAEQKLSLRALIALVVGSMIGSGIFALPSAFGRATGGLGALIAWAIAGVGMLMLAFVFQTLARRKPDLDAGIYAYAKAGFGDYPGFASAVGYWIGACLADVACLVLIKATLGQFFPVFGDGTTPTRHPRRLRPAVGRACPGPARHQGGGGDQHHRDRRQDRADRALHRRRHRRLQGRHLRAEFLGRRGAQPSATWRARSRSSMLVTVFLFVGIEGASVYSRYARNRERRRRRHGAGLPRRALPAHPGHHALVRRDAAPGPGGAGVRPRWPASWKPSSGPGARSSSASGC